VPNTYDVLEQPDIVIIEGLNVLQSPGTDPGANHVFVSDYFDFTIYVDAPIEYLQKWYCERFLALRNTAFRDPTSYFHRYANLTDEEAAAMAHEIWIAINQVNLEQNILPTRERAHLILEKTADHSVQGVRLRKI